MRGKKINLILQDSEVGKVEITAYFKQIDLVLFYTIAREGVYTPQRVAQITAGDLQLNSTMADVKHSSGGIGSIVVTDLSNNK